MFFIFCFDRTGWVGPELSDKNVFETEKKIVTEIGWVGQTDIFLFEKLFFCFKNFLFWTFRTHSPSSVKTENIQLFFYFLIPNKQFCVAPLYIMLLLQEMSQKKCLDTEDSPTNFVVSWQKGPIFCEV